MWFQIGMKWIQGELQFYKCEGKMFMIGSDMMKSDQLYLEKCNVTKNNPQRIGLGFETRKHHIKIGLLNYAMQWLWGWFILPMWKSHIGKIHSYNFLYLYK